MVRVWNRLVVPAIGALGGALLAFALLVLVSPGSGRHLARPGLIVVTATAVTLALLYAYVRTSRPHLGVQD
jgi:Na+/H+ antiporter NhaA